MKQADIWNFVPKPTSSRGSEKDAMWDYVEGIAKGLYPDNRDMARNAKLSGAQIFHDVIDPVASQDEIVPERLRPQEFVGWLGEQMIAGALQINERLEELNSR